ncbi:hypothetical protein EK21DRAFT_62479 [Setomelanomma holmii]|uniref:Serine-threonine protein kinase 19-domain-containing protein n=1 Tax=Setomelanomma holmii TaxID=210430 RepID=A0A9P4HDK6_9PLEO|nr:hypothetical protein EK21DRAFT_62479 [Setomelanomma holmii]
MSFQATPARSSRITKSRRPSAAAALGLKRSTSTPSSASPRKRSLASQTSVQYDDDEQLDDTGVIVSLADDLNFRDVPQYMEYIRNRITHVDALGKSSTMIEREVSELSRAGILRRVTIPNRGIGAAAVGTAFTPAELSTLIGVGLLTSTSASSSHLSYFASPGAASLTSISSSGSRHAAGSLDAIGGTSATQHMHGGTSLNSFRPSLSNYNFSLPNTGVHIKLLVDARNHLLGILKKTKHKELPMDMLRERWDGGVVVHGEREERKKARGEFAGVLPGKTKKWRQFYGMRFEWILEECLGAGLVELFETGSVGRAVRATT